jgi:hypothetical protein
VQGHYVSLGVGGVDWEHNQDLLFTIILSWLVVIKRKGTGPARANYYVGSFTMGVILCQYKTRQYAGSRRIVCPDSAGTAPPLESRKKGTPITDEAVGRATKTTKTTRAVGGVPGPTEP